MSENGNPVVVENLLQRLDETASALRASEANGWDAATDLLSDMSSLLRQAQAELGRLRAEVERLREAQAESERLLQRAEERRAEGIASETALANSLLRALLDTMPIGVIVCDADGALLMTNSPGKEILGGHVYGSIRASQRTYTPYYPDGSPFPVEEMPLMRAVERKEIVRNVEILIRRGDGSERTILAGAAPVLDARGRVVSGVTVFQDITGRALAEDALRDALDESRRREAEVSALLAATRAILEHREFAGTARAIFDSCKALVGAAAGYIALLTADGSQNDLVFLDAGGLPCLVDPNLPMPVRGLRAKAYRTGRTVYENRFAQSEWVQYLPEGRVAMDNVLFAPLVIEGQVMGLLGLANKQGGFTEREARMAAAFGELAAIALRNSQAVDSLEHSEGRYRTLFETMAQGVVYHDADGRITSANPAAARILGLTLDQMQGRTSMDPRWKAIHADGSDFPGDAHPAMIALRTGEEVRDAVMGVFNPQKEDYTWINVNATSQFRPGEDTPYQVYAIFEDITERKRAEDVLRDQVHLLENISDAVISSDVNFVIQSWNRAAEEIYGWRADEVVGRPVTEVLKGEYDEPIEDVVKRFFADGHWKGEVRQRRKDGTPVHILSSVRLLRDNAGNPVSVVSANHDITERKQAEEVLREERDFIAAVLKTAGALVVVLDWEGRIVRFNQACEQVTGYSFDEIRGRPFWDIFLVPEEVAPAKDVFAELSNGRFLENHEDYWVAKDGSRRLIAWSNTVLLDSEDKVEFVIGTGIDVTERRQAEEALAREVEVNAAIAALSSALIASTSIDDISRLTLEHAKRLTSSAFGFVGYADSQAGRLVSSTMPQDVWQTCQVADKAVIFEKFGGLWGWVIKNRQPLFTNSPVDDPRSTGTPAGHIPIQRFLSVPTLIGDELAGLIALANAERDYTERDLELVERLARLYALVVQRAQVKEVLERRNRDLGLLNR